MPTNSIIIIPMTMEEYKEKYGENTDLWDYPLTEIPYLIEKLKDELDEGPVNNIFAIIKTDYGEYRLFETDE